jgi:N utilization substance protein B
MNKLQIRARQKARQMAVQALYQWKMSQDPMVDIEAQFRSIHSMEKVDGDYLSFVLQGIEKNKEAVDQSFEPYLDRALHELNPVELSVLRLGAFELQFCPETPYRIILEEAVLLTKTFGSQDGFRYVNGVLNQCARIWREHEIDRA